MFSSQAEPVMTTAEVPMPARLAKLPRDKHGRVVPWFVAWPGGQPDHRIADQAKFGEALRFGRCWLCGGPLGAYKAFIVGPMCAVNRIDAEPPSHRDCAIYSVQVCPWLMTPVMRRRDSGKTELGVVNPAGVMIERNPGVTLVWISKSYRLMRVSASEGAESGVLLMMGDPVETLWWAEGRPATRQEILDSIASGLPLLREQAEKDGPPAPCSSYPDSDDAVDEEGGQPA